MKRMLFFILLIITATSYAGLPNDPKMGSVTKQDFFLYSCVREYMKANSIQVFDGSVAYGVEYSSLSHEELTQTYEAAKEFASTIRAPEYGDTEHGLPAVLVLCQKEARKL